MCRGVRPVRVRPVHPVEKLFGIIVYQLPLERTWESYTTMTISIVRLGTLLQRSIPQYITGQWQPVRRLIEPRNDTTRYFKSILTVTPFPVTLETVQRPDTFFVFHVFHRFVRRKFDDLSTLEDKIFGGILVKEIVRKLSVCSTIRFQGNFVVNCTFWSLER